VISRVRREGQKFPVQFFHVQSSHRTHELLVRNHNGGRQATLMDFGFIDEENEANEMEGCFHATCEGDICEDDLYVSLVFVNIDLPEILCIL
jgi:hypothetical protein